MGPKKEKKQKKKVIKQPAFSDEELNQEIDTFLTSQNPYASESCVEFDKRAKEFKSINDYKKPVIFYRTKTAIKRRIGGGDFGIVYEEVDDLGKKKMNNKFNFRSKTTQTISCDPKDKNVYIDPNFSPVLRFFGSASKYEITAAYEQNEAMKRIQDSPWINLDLNKILRHTNQKELELGEKNQKYLRLCERMLDQNKSEANLDLNFYEDPNDDFKPNAGSLLPLWKLIGKGSGEFGVSVTSFSWNTTYDDLVAVGFGRTKPDEEDDKDEDGLGVVRDRGCVCVFSLKATSHPYRLFRCNSGVCSVQFHPSLPQLLAVAFFDGGVAVYDMRTSTAVHRGRDSKFMKYYHCDKVTNVQWLSDELPQKFCSVSHDGKILTWLFLVNDLFPDDLIFSLRLKHWPIDPPPKGLEMILEPKKDVGDSLELNTSATALSVNPVTEDLFLVGTETGLLHQFSFHDKRCLQNFEDHSGDVYNVRWNPLHPRVFMSCSKDFTVQIWDQATTPAVFEFFFENEILDIAWAPFSSTLFAIISAGTAMVSVFDLAVNRREAIGTYRVYTWKEEIGLTKVAFHPKKPILVVGDDRGTVIVFKLSPNLRSSLKALDTMEYSKFVSGEVEKLDKLLVSAKVSDKFA